MSGLAKFTVYVGDNFHMFDENHVGMHDTFQTLPAALEACKCIVDEFLTSAHKPGMKPDELLQVYKMFGDDPFVVAADNSKVAFSAWVYAAERCALICRPKVPGC